MKRIAVIFATILVLILALPTFAFAGTGYTTNQFDVQVDIKPNHICEVNETIKVDFKTFKHGIFRYIPYQPGIYKIKGVDVKNDMYESYSEYNNGWQQIIKIGDPDNTITGKHKYDISYKLVCYEDEDKDKDYLSIDLLPTDWETSIKKSHITVKLPKAVDEKALRLYVGQYGSTEKEAAVDFTYDKKNKSITIDGAKLQKGCGITLSAELPEGYWVNPTNRRWMAVPLVAILAVVPAILALLWLLFGRDPKVVKTVEFYPPNGMTPSEIGYVIDGTVDYKDMVALIMYFAEKGYIQIKEYKKNRFELIKIKEIDSAEKSFARTFFNGLFDGGKSVRTNKLPENFADDFQVSQDQLRRQFKGRKALFTTSSKVCRVLGLAMMFMPPIVSVAIAAAATFSAAYYFALIPIGLFLLLSMTWIIMLFDRWDSTSKTKRRSSLLIATVLAAVGVLCSALVTAKLMESVLYGALVALSSAITFIAVIFMKKRSPESAALYGKVLGFRDFIETAELEKLNMLVEEDPSYFYNIMPYAYVMGLSGKWAKKFENINIQKADWYYGYGSDPVFNALWYSHMFNSCTKSVESNVIKSIAAAASDSGGGSIGGGFGGGGFSGGGFGGGGGGSW